MWPLVVAAGRKWISANAAADLSDLSERVTIAENHRQTLLDMREALRGSSRRKSIRSPNCAVAMAQKTAAKLQWPAA